MLSKLCWLYQKSSKRLTELKELSEVFEKSIPKPTKADGTRWIDFKYQAMEKVLSNYSPYMTHLEQLAHTNSQPKKREEIKGFVNKWKDAGYLMHISIFIDILSLMCRLSFSLQRDKHDPVKVTRCLSEFTWTMSKLRLLIENSLDNDGDGQVKTCFKTFRSKVENYGGKFFYQGIKLSKYELTIEHAKTVYTSAISTICTKVEQRFSSFTESVAFSNILLLLDTSLWPRNDSFSFGNLEIDELTDHYLALLEKNGCDVHKIPNKWIRLKTYIYPILHNSPDESYLEVWHRTFINGEAMAECNNIFEILLIVPFTNAIVERLFSRMNKVKIDFCNRLSQSRLDTCLRVGEEGSDIKNFDPDRVINRWWIEKERRQKSGPHDYPATKKPRMNSAEYVNLSTLTMSDLENSDDEAFFSF